jgi:hypothetical protein
MSKAWIPCMTPSSLMRTDPSSLRRKYVEMPNSVCAKIQFSS